MTSPERGSWFCGFLVTLCCVALSAACSEGRPTPSTLAVQVEVVDQMGRPMADARVQVGPSDIITPESGVVEQLVDAAEGPTRASVICPERYRADRRSRSIPMTLARASASPRLRFICRATRVRTAVVVVVRGTSEGELKLSLDGEVLGPTHHGVRHLLVEGTPGQAFTLAAEAAGDEELRGESQPVIVLGRSDDLQVVTFEVEVPVTRLRTRSRAPSRPYRL